MSRLDRCVCGGPHTWRCAIGIMRDRFIQVVVRRAWTATIYFYARAINAYQRVKLENRELRAEISRLRGNQ